MSKINVSVGTRELGPQAPVTYEIPRDVVAEAIVNAVAHRDYNSNGSVQVMLFSDRLEVWNPGTLPKALTLADLRRAHSSIPGNPLLAEPLYLTKYIERMGTGIIDMIHRCRKAGLAEPEIRIDGGSFVLTIRRKKAEPGPKSAPRRAQDKAHGAQDEAHETHVLLTPIEIGILAACATSLRAIHELLGVAGYSSRTGNFKRSMDKLLQGDLIAMTIPDKPRSGNQRYEATAKGKALLAELEKQGDNQ